MASHYPSRIVARQIILKLQITIFLKPQTLTGFVLALKAFGQPKTTVAQREIYEINPYAKVQQFTQGLTEANIEDFFVGDNRLNIVFDVVDDSYESEN